MSAVGLSAIVSATMKKPTRLTMLEIVGTAIVATKLLALRERLGGIADCGLRDIDLAVRSARRCITDIGNLL